MNELTQQQTQLLKEIQDGHKIVCLHIFGQGLVDQLVEIIKIREAEFNLHMQSHVNNELNYVPVKHRPRDTDFPQCAH